MMGEAQRGREVGAQPGLFVEAPVRPEADLSVVAETCQNDDRLAGRAART